MLKIGYFPENVKLDVFKHSYLEKVMVTKVLKFYSDASKGPRINIEPKIGVLEFFFSASQPIVSSEMRKPPPSKKTFKNIFLSPMLSPDFAPV